MNEEQSAAFSIPKASRSPIGPAGNCTNRLAGSILRRQRAADVLTAAALVVAGPAWAAASQCAMFQDAGQLVQIVVEDEGPRTSPPASFDPAVSVRLAYPNDYRSLPLTTAGQTMLRHQDGENFVMRMDGGPLPWLMRHTLAGKPIKPDDQPPSFRFLIHDRYSVEKLVPIRIRTVTGLPWSFDMIPFTLIPAETEGLFEVTDVKTPTYQNKRIFVTTMEAPFKDLLECNIPAHGMSPQCEHQFDYKAVDITASYSLQLFGRWKEIKSLIQTFLACAYAEEIPHKSGTNPVWD